MQTKSPARPAAFLCAFGLIGIAFAYSKFVHQILPNRSELLNEVSIICPYNNSVLEREKQKRKRRFKTSTASFAMPDARSNRSGRRRRPDNQQCRATGFTYISPPSPSFPICYEKNMAPLCSGQGFAACLTQRAHRLLFQNILYHHRLAISANRASTSSSRVAQLVQNRTAVCSASGLAVRVMAYFSLRALYQLLGRMGNCWLVGESNSMAQPLLQTQRGCAWPGGPP